MKSAKTPHFPYRAQSKLETPSMRTTQETISHSQRYEHRYDLHRGLGFWELIFEGQRAVFKHEQGALYVACLLRDPPPEPIHAVALTLKARKINGQATGEAELIQERNLGLDDAEAVRMLRRKQRELETVLDDGPGHRGSKGGGAAGAGGDPQFLRKNSWRARDNAGRCVRAVAVAIKRFHARLAKAVDAEGRPHPVLQGFARHLREHLLIPSGRGGGQGGEGKLVGGGVLYLRAAAGGSVGSEGRRRKTVIKGKAETLTR